MSHCKNQIHSYPAPLRSSAQQLAYSIIAITFFYGVNSIEVYLNVQFRVAKGDWMQEGTVLSVILQDLQFN